MVNQSQLEQTLKWRARKLTTIQSEIRGKLDCLRQKHSEERKPNDPCIFIHRVTPFFKTRNNLQVNILAQK